MAMERRMGLVETTPKKERGENVRIVLKFIRHGERTKEGELTDLGRRITRERARDKRIENQDYDAVKAVGSTAGPKGARGMQRALETADIYASETPHDGDFKTRPRPILSYETLKSKPPYEHGTIYNSYLPENFKELPDEEKIKASKKAQTATVNHLLSLKSSEAETYKKEVAGSFATFIEHYREMAKRLKSGSKVLIPSGTHGGTMELLLQQALVREETDGKKVLGFENLDEIGGDFDPSDSYNVDIGTNDRGDFRELAVTFDNPKRPATRKMYLDPDKIKELSEFYRSLHMNEKGNLETS